MRKVGVVGASRGTRVFRHLSYFLAESRDYSQSVSSIVYTKLDMTNGT